MTIDRKHREPINIVPTARVVITTNLLPEFKDVSEGIRRRMVPLTFGVTVAEDKRDALLSEKLLVELPGIFNWAVQGLARLRSRRFFAIPESSRMLLEMMQPEMSSAQQFFESHVEEAPGAFTATDDLYQGYKAWFDSQSGIVVVSKTRFGQQLQWSWPAAKKGREGGGGRRWGYVGIRLKPVSQVSATSEMSDDFLSAFLQEARRKKEGKASDGSDGQDQPAKAAA
jgi:putative DNA primase/helicase